MTPIMGMGLLLAGLMLAGSKTSPTIPGRWRVKAKYLGKNNPDASSVASAVASELDGRVTALVSSAEDSTGLTVEFDFGGEEAPIVSQYPGGYWVMAVRPLRQKDVAEET